MEIIIHHIVTLITGIKLQHLFSFLTTNWNFILIYSGASFIRQPSIRIPRLFNILLSEYFLGTSNWNGSFETMYYWKIKFRTPWIRMNEVRLYFDSHPSREKRRYLIIDDSNVQKLHCVIICWLICHTTKSTLKHH